jgi:PAS domain S-box-containing protein
LLFEHTLIGLYRTTPDGRVLMVNPALVKMLGYSSAKELCERGLSDAVYEPQHTRSEFIDRIERDGQIVGLEAAWTRQDGTTLHVRESAKAIRDASGRTLYYEGSVEDITERKHIEQHLLLLSSIVEQSTECIAASDLEGNIKFVNKAYARTHGYTVDALIGKNLAMVHTPEQMPYCRAVIREVQETGVFNGEIYHARKDGSVFPALMHSTLLRDDSGKPIGMIATMHDISERKQAEEALRVSQDRYRLVIDNAGCPITLLDCEGRIQLINDVGAKNLRGTPPALIGKTLQETFPDIADKLTRRHLHILKSGKGHTYEDVMDLPDGKRWFQSNLQPVRDSGGQIVGLQIISQDITELRRTERELRAATKELAAEHERVTDQNIALTQILKHIESQKQIYRRQICDEIEHSLTPLIEHLREGNGADRAGALEAIRTTLHGILTRDLDDFQGRYAKLTSRETEICDMIRARMSTKEISSALGVSPLTVSKHREQIRRKLGITNKNVNLATYLRLQRLGQPHTPVH